MARGKQGIVWRLETSEGSWAVKVSHHRLPQEEVRGAALFQEAAHAAGVPTPQVRRTTDGRAFATIDGQQVRVYQWVDLLPPDPTLDPESVGAVVATVHRVSVTGGGAVDPWYYEPVGAGRWDQLLGQLVEAGAPFAGRMAGLLDELVALEGWIEPLRTRQTCHRDLWADNLLPLAGGGVCVIDWDNSGPADPSQELGCVLFEFGRQDPGRARALVRANRQAGGKALQKRRGQLVHAYCSARQLGHITELAARDWLTPNPRSPERADSEAWIGETLDEPHDRDLLDSPLAAVSDDSPRSRHRDSTP